MRGTPTDTRAPRRSLRCGLAALALVAAVTVMESCGSSPAAPGGTSNTTAPVTQPPTSGNPGGGPILSGTGVLIGAGDIAQCSNGVVSPGLIATTKLLEERLGTGTVFAAGDNAYQNGTTAEYRDCYDPWWGRFRDRTWPVPGNHEYESAGAQPYYQYFGAAAGNAGEGYWLRTLGTWTVVGLNSESGNLPAQIQRLKTDLGNPANKTNCTLAIWHRPLFSAGNNDDANKGSTSMRDTWQALYDLGVDVIVNGHEHLYQRYFPQDANENLDSAKGIVQFTVGTGGATLYNPVPPVHRNSAKIISAFGVAKFTLNENAYTWEFINIDKGGESDFGSAACHF